MSDQGDTPQTTASQPTGPQIVRRSPRWMKILLVLSLALNLAAAGFVVSRIAFGPRFVEAGPMASIMDARKLLWVLPRERRHALREEYIGRYRSEFTDKRAEWRTARQGLASVLAKPDASEEEIMGAFGKLAQIEARTSRRWREILADMTLQLSAEERAILARRLLRGRRHGRPIGYHHRAPDPRPSFDDPAPVGRQRVESVL